MNIETLIANIKKFIAENDEVTDHTIEFRIEEARIILAALRSQQQGQGEPVACSGTRSCDLPNVQCGYPNCAYGKAKVTSPPAPARSRELLDSDITHEWNSTGFGSPLTPTGIQAVRNIIAADRAIRPAAGMVSDERSERVIAAAEKMRQFVWNGSNEEIEAACREFDKAKQP